MNLNSRFVEFGDARQFFAHVDVWIVTLGERRLELLQLFLGERGSVATSRRRLTCRRRIQHVTGSNRRRHYTASGRGCRAV